MTAKKIDKRRIGHRSPRRKRVKFNCHSIDAQSVFLAGSFNEWNPTALPMKRDQEGNWSTEALLHCGRYEFKFIVDGEWVCRPQCTGDHLCADCVTNDHGTMNRILEVV